MPKPIKVRRPAKSGKAKVPEKSSLNWPVIVLGAGAVVLLLLAVLLGPSMYREIVRSGALTRIGSAVNGAAEKSDFAQAAKLIEPDLEYFAEFIALENDPKRQQALNGILAAFPSEKLPAECFAISRPSVLFPTVVRIAARRPREWLIENSCHKSLEIRGVAAEALVTQLPNGTAPAAAIAKLAEPLTIEQKQQEFQRLYDDQHQQLEQALVGDWTLQLHAEFRGVNQSQTADYELTGHPVSISCQQRQWTVKFFNQSWTGSLEQMRALSLKASLKDVAVALLQFPLRGALAQSSLELQLAFAPPQGFTIQAVGFPKSRPDSAWSIAQSKGTTIRIQNKDFELRVPSTPAGATFSTFEIKESRDTSFGRIDIEASGSDGEVGVARWRMKGEPGFSKFELTALSPRQVAEAKAANEKPVRVVQKDEQPMPDIPPAVHVQPRGQWREWRAVMDPTSNILVVRDGERFGVISADVSKEGKPLQHDFQIWQSEDSTIVERNAGYPLPRSTIFASSRDTKRIVTAETLRSGRDGIQVRVWDIDENGKLSNPRPLQFPFRDVLLAASEQAKLDAGQLQNLIANNEAKFLARSIAVSPTGRWGAVANGQGAVCFYDLDAAKLVDQILVVIDRDEGILKEKYWSALSHQPVFLSDEEVVVGGYVLNVADRRHFVDMRVPELMAQVTGGTDPFPTVIAMPGHRRLFAVLGREVREVRMPIIPDPNKAAATTSLPAFDGRAARSSPQRPVPAKKTSKPIAPVKTPEKPLRVFGHEHPVTAVAISSEGKHFATADEKGQLSLWDLADGKLLKAASLDAGPIRRLAFVSNGQRIASGHADGTIRIWNLAELEDRSQGRFRFETLVSELPKVSETKLYPVSDNKRLIIAGGKGWLFDIEKSEVLQRDLVLAESWTADLKYALNGSELLDLKSNRKLATLRAKKTSFAEGELETTAATFLPNGRAVIVARKSGKIESWKVPAGDLDVSNSDSQAESEILVASADGTALFLSKHIVVTQSEPVVRRLDAKSLKELNRFSIPKNVTIVSGLAVSPDGSLCALIAPDRVSVVQSDTGQVVHEEPNHAHAQFTLDGKWLVTASRSEIGNSGSALCIRNVADWGLMRETKAISHVYSLAITPNGRWLFVVAPSGLLKAALPE